MRSDSLPPFVNAISSLDGLNIPRSLSLIKDIEGDASVPSENKALPSKVETPVTLRLPIPALPEMSTSELKVETPVTLRLPIPALPEISISALTSTVSPNVDTPVTFKDPIPALPEISISALTSTVSPNVDTPVTFN